ncbi:rod shape-determining protein MreD [Epibacterium sp. SM1969]|uniref:Rod shape-determining protein MreD n=1 Tax=Tritonibacter aquimaris TaxID=2663379 RepID=A0A844AN01_9RHOB|nr:rod shape-determining protein MreD [Tritonibacter aquimaris]MQY43755.1 rod shape-determining protein MreD [Tritonibacter aquimaris]
MISEYRAKIWIMRAAFAAIALIVLFFQLLPLETTTRKWAPPDVIMVLAVVWSLRRPDYVPAPLLAAVLLLSDLLLQRPPGLQALLVIIACEFLKARVASHRDMAFAAEWLEAALIFAATTALYRSILSMTGVAQPSLTLSLIQMVMNIIAYPLLVGLSQSVLGVRKLTPVEADALGAR